MHFQVGFLPEPSGAEVRARLGGDGGRATGAAAVGMSEPDAARLLKVAGLNEVRASAQSQSAVSKSAVYALSMVPESPLAANSISYIPDGIKKCNYAISKTVLYTLWRRKESSTLF